jgi:hypothetical protein
MRAGGQTGMAKRSILDPEFELLETEKGERVVLHARKGKLIFKPSLLARAANFGGGAAGGAASRASGHRSQKIVYKGEVVLTNQAIWCGKVGGLFKKKVRRFLVAVHDPAYAEEWVQSAVSQIQVTTPNRWTRRLTGVEKIYFITQFVTGKGWLSKGFDMKLVRFNPAGHRSGLLQKFRNANQAFDSSFAGETWAVRLSKMAPGYDMSSGALDGALASAQANSQQIVLLLPRFNQIADAGAASRAPGAS